ncbi:MAG: pyridoxal phosphate-dependent aminotransferase [Brumimicrobium sp.]|nr:pyridoxal phosphate-dependent aminotransferase [Brumimicrobium sp.]MCO5268826.1 pyridoxal phosphate-dependent aminotransferase [Brumimicrobium sp.]
MIKFSDRLNNMEESATLAMSRLSRELKQQGKDVISLSLGEPDFATPSFIEDAAIEGMKEGYTKYPPVPGYDDLRQAICDKFQRDNNLHYEINQVVVSTGAKQSIANVVLSIINPGDEVLVPAPYWVSYIEIVKLAGGIPISIPSSIENDYKVTGKQVEEKISNKTKLFIFSTPCNPTGSLYSKEELKELANVFAKYKDIVIISDEIYEHINFSGKHESIAQFPEVYNQTVVVNGLSKAWAMTGWRLGYIGAPKEIAAACTKMQGQFTSGANSIAQRAAIAALRKETSYLKEMISAFKNRRDIVYKGLLEIKGLHVNLPKAAFYFFPDISDLFGKTTPKGQVIQTSNDLSTYILDEVLVALVPGEAFGNPNSIRISYATDEATLTEALRRIKIAIEKLK